MTNRGDRIRYLAQHYGLLFVQWFQIKAQPVLRKLNWPVIRQGSFIILFSFILASSVSTLAGSMVLNAFASQRVLASKVSDRLFEQINTGSKNNQIGFTKELQREVLNRNVFNFDGTLPPESDAGTATKTKDLDFAKVDCTYEALPVEVRGVIYTGDPARSFVSLKDPKIEDSDIYKPGDLIIDHEDYEIYRVYHRFFEVRKGDTKICYNFDGANGNSLQASGGANGQQKAEPTELFELDQNYVNEEIGPGYANILNAAKMIPDVDGSGKTAGFKMLSIRSGSLFDKIGLQNGDRVFDVNGTSLKDASQGFKLYQALQEEREITIGVVRGGQTITKQVRIK